MSRRFIAPTALFCILGILVLAWVKHWAIYDYFRLRNYHPSAAVAQLASDDTMKPSTRNLFYVYHPELQDKDTFRTSCNSAERTIVLGCYVAGQGIYLSNITDERLQGVLQVTAAHETLHAAYDRLSMKEKSRVDSLINAAYAKVTDERIRQTIDSYQKDGADIRNELHSILGTEVGDLPAELETYYSRYFENRKSIVAFSEKYEAAFTARKNQVAEADANLANLKQQIDNIQSSLNAQQAVLTSERARLDGLLSAKEVEAYNAGVPSFNAKVNKYNSDVRTVRGLIDQYNTLVKERNAIALEESELVKAIDSRPNTIDQ